MGMLSSTATMIAASPGFEVISIEATGDVARWPVIAWGVSYGYVDGILPIALGIVFNGDQHAVAMPDGRVLTTIGGEPRWWKDGKAWADAVNAAMASRAWQQAGVPTAGEA